MKEKTNICIAVSGGGRSLKNLIDWQHAGKTDFNVSCVISSKDTCGANDFAREKNIPLLVSSEKKIEADLIEAFIKKHNAQWIVLAGFLKKFPNLSSFQNRIINIHPALLPDFGGKGMYGLHVHEAVIRAQKKTSGATIHFVNENYDEGNIIAQIFVDIEKNDSAEILAKKVFEKECLLLPVTINKLINGELPLQNNQIWHHP